METETELQRLVRVREERRYARAMRIHGLPDRAERVAELEAWAEQTVAGWETVVRMATCSCRMCTTRRAGTETWTASGPPGRGLKAAAARRRAGRTRQGRSAYGRPGALSQRSTTPLTPTPRTKPSITARRGARSMSGVTSYRFYVRSRLDAALSSQNRVLGGL